MRWNLLHTVWLSVCALAATAQPIDSLKLAYDTADDTSRVLIAIELGNLLGPTDSVASFDWFEKGISSAEAGAVPRYVHKALQKKARMYENYSDMANALETYQRSLERCRELDYTLGVARSYSDLGFIYQHTGRYDLGIESYGLAHTMHLALGNVERSATELANQAHGYYSAANYQKAIECGLRCLAIHDSLGLDSTDGIATAYNNMGIAYEKLRDYDNSERCVLAALAVYKHLNNQVGQARCYNNLGNVANGRKDYQSAYEQHLRTKALWDSLDYLPGVAVSCNNIAQALGELGNMAESKAYALQAYQLNEKQGDPRGKALAAILLISAEDAGGNLPRALEYCEECFELAAEMNEPSIRATCMENKAELLARQSKFEEAYRMHEAFSALRDSLLGVERQKEVASLQVRYETAKKDRENLRLTAKSAEQERDLAASALEIERQANQRNVLIGLLLVLLLLAGGGFYGYRQRQQRALQAELLNQEQMRLKAVILAQEDERKRIAGELHDGIGQLLTAVKLNVSALTDSTKSADEGAQKQFTTALELIDESVREVRGISHNMMPAALMHQGLIAALEELAGRISSSGKLLVQFDGMLDEQRLPEVVEVHLYRILQELTSNIIKYASATEVQVQLGKDDDRVTVMVEDNGQGFDIKKLMRGTGNGWSNIKSRLGLLSGTIEIDSRPGRVGTVVFLDVPAF